MRKYAQPRPGSRGPTGLSAAYLEADLDDEEAEEYGDGEGLTATERARAALARPRRIDEAAEVRKWQRLCWGRSDNGHVRCKKIAALAILTRLPRQQTPHCSQLLCMYPVSKLN